MADNKEDKGGELFLYVTYISINRKVASDCKRIMQILDSHNIRYTLVDLGIVPEKRQEMVSISGKTELPQVFIDKEFIGGIDQIEEWNENEVLAHELYECGYGDEPPPKNEA